MILSKTSERSSQTKKMKTTLVLDLLVVLGEFGDGSFSSLSWCLYNPHNIAASNSCLFSHSPVATSKWKGKAVEGVRKMRWTLTRLGYPAWGIGFRGNRR